MSPHHSRNSRRVATGAAANRNLLPRTVRLRMSVAYETAQNDSQVVMLQANPNNVNQPYIIGRQARMQDHADSEPRLEFEIPAVPGLIDSRWIEVPCWMPEVDKQNLECIWRRRQEREFRACLKLSGEGHTRAGAILSLPGLAGSVEAAWLERLRPGHNAFVLD